MIKLIVIFYSIFFLTWCIFNASADITDIERANFISKLANDSSLFEYLPENIRNDRKIAEVAVKKNIENIWHINNDIRRDKDFLLQIVDGLDDFNAIPYIPTEYLNDEDFVFSLLKKEKTLTNFIPPQLLQNQNFINRILQMKDPPVFFVDYIPRDLKDSKEEILNIINLANKEEIRRIFLSFSKDFFADTELVSKVLLKSPLAYQYLDGNLKNSRDLSLIAIKGDSYNFQYLPWKFRIDKEFIGLVDPARFELKEEIIEEAPIIEDIDYIAYASEELRNNKNLFLKLLKIEDNYYFEDMISSASENLRHDKDFAIQVVSINWRALAYFDSTIRSDKEVVSAANPTDLWVASPELKSDKEFVLSLFNNSNDPTSFFWNIDPALRTDLDIAIIWAEFDPLSIFEISPTLRTEVKFLSTYVSNFPKNMKYLPYLHRLVYESLENCLLRVKYRDTNKVDVCSDDFEKLDKKGNLVKWIWYDKSNKYLIIRLNDTNYHYCGFINSDWKSMKASKDIDSFYKSDIQWKYNCISEIIPKY